MTPETKAILEQFERRQQARFGALAEMLNQSIEAMALDRQRLYQMLAQREAVAPAPPTTPTETPE